MTKKPKAPNWDKIIAEYRTGDYTLTELAKKHKVHYRTLLARKKRAEELGNPWITEKELAALKAKKKVRIAEGNPSPVRMFQEGNSARKEHGLFSKLLPDESLEIFNAIEAFDVKDMLWHQIKILYTNILRAQEIMFVKNKDDITKELKSNSSTDKGDSIEYDIQYAWDKQAKLLSAQSSAASTLRSLINQFVAISDEADERRLKLEQMGLTIEKVRAEINKLKEPEQDKTIQINLVKRGGKGGDSK